jgi:hypothetical protein
LLPPVGARSSVETSGPSGASSRTCSTPPLPEYRAESRSMFVKLIGSK